MKATEQYFPVVLFIMLYKVILTFESVCEILKCDHSNESYWNSLLFCALFMLILEYSLTKRFLLETLIVFRISSAPQQNKGDDSGAKG